MCGRYGISVTKNELREYLSKNYNIDVLDENIILPRYNITPGQNAISLISDGTKFRIGLLKWGFVPDWSTDENIGYHMINARSETLSTKPSFKKSFKQKRCIIIADGFFEWYRTTSTKTPYYFYLKNRKIFGFAGLWTVKTRSDGSKLYTCTIITTKANTIMDDIHDRMPIILSEKAAKIWMDPNLRDINALNKILKSDEMDDLQFHKVSSRVNKAENDDLGLIMKVD